MLRKAKLLVPAAVILLWVTMMGILVHREVIVPRRHPSLAAARVTEPQDMWMGLFYGERRIGFVHWTTTPETRDDDPGYRLRFQARMSLPVMGEGVAVALEGGGWQSALLGLREFDLSFRSGDQDMRILGSVEKDRILGTVETGGEITPLELPVAGGLSLGSGMGLSSMSMPPLSPGETVYVETFDPTTMSVGRAKLEAVEKATLTVGGQAVETVLINTTIGGMTSRAWVNDKQEVVRAETPFGLNLERIDPRDALAPLSDDEQAGMVQRLAVVPAGARPVRDAVRMRIRVDGVPGALLPPDGPAQRRTGSEYLLEQLAPPAPDAETEMITGPEAEQHLRTDAFITVDNPKIRELAAEITGQEEDLWTRALRVHDWVYQNIEKTATMSMPSAVEVLRTRQGDCNEHSVLFAALARAAGVPARIAIGLAWSEALSAFGYHAWVEVYAGRWIPMDPTFGQPTADATHLKLFDGSLEEWPRLLGYVGNLKIEVLEVEGP